MPEAIRERTRVAVLISGRGSNMAALIYASRAEDCPFEIALVASDRPNAPGLAWAITEGVPTRAFDAKASGPAFWDELSSALQAANVGVVALAGFMRILPADFVERWSGRLLNIHPSLLPKYKGLDPHAKAIAAGDSHAGCSVHLVTSEVDAGEVLGQVPVAILPGDTPDMLADRVRIAEHGLYPRILAAFVTSERDPEWITEKVGQLALALPETRAKTSHGAPGWRVGSESSGKFFAIMWLGHHGEDGTAVLVKCSGQDELADLIDSAPDLYFRPQYYGPSNWIGLRLDRTGVDWTHVAEWLEKSWAAVAPARLGKLRQIAGEF